EVRRCATQHAKREVDADNLSGGVGVEDRLGEPAGAGADVKYGVVWSARECVGYSAAPANVLTEGHERVHQVVPPRDAPEHLGDVARLLGWRRQDGAHDWAVSPTWDPPGRGGALNGRTRVVRSTERKC